MELRSLVTALQEAVKGKSDTAQLDSAFEKAGYEIFTNDPREYVEALQELMDAHDFEPAERQILDRALKHFRNPTLRQEASKLRRLTR